MQVKLTAVTLGCMVEARRSSVRRWAGGLFKIQGFSFNVQGIGSGWLEDFGAI